MVMSLLKSEVCDVLSPVPDCRVVYNSQPPRKLCIRTPAPLALLLTPTDSRGWWLVDAAGTSTSTSSSNRKASDPLPPPSCTPPGAHQLRRVRSPHLQPVRASLLSQLKHVTDEERRGRRRKEKKSQRRGGSLQSALVHSCSRVLFTPQAHHQLALSAPLCRPLCFLRCGERPKFSRTSPQHPLPRQRRLTRRQERS
jgi:hypothetical protein